MTSNTTHLRESYNLMKEIRFQISELEKENIDADDFIQAIEEIYWHYSKLLNNE